MIIGCTSSKSIIQSKRNISYKDIVKGYNSDYRILKIMPDYTYIAIIDNHKNIKIIAIDKNNKKIVDEYDISNVR